MHIYLTFYISSSPVSPSPSLYCVNWIMDLFQTVFGRHAYFRHFAVKMFSRFGIPAELMDKSFHQTAKNFRKY